VKKRTAWVLLAGVVAVALGAAAVGVVAVLVRGGGRSPVGWTGSGAVLSVNVSGDLAERASPAWTELLETPRPSLRATIEGIEGAARDERVSGLVLRVGPLGAGWARVQELREAVVRFRASGKPSWAHLEYAGNREYYLASACEHIAAAPTALLNVSGLAAEVTFFRGALDKVGVQAQFEGVGKYKNAPNQFTETGFTGPHREQVESLLDSLFSQYVAAVAAGRGLDEERVREIIDRGPFDAEEASTLGLVDELLYRDEVHERLPTTDRIGVARYVSDTRGFGFDGRPKVALVYALGEIMPGETATGPFGGSGFAGADTISRGLREAADDDSIRAIVLRVDSPGGVGMAADAVWREVDRARLRKPVIASLGDAAASGGYYIAMNAHAIVAQPGTITGSIGVFSGKFALGGLYEKLGLSHEVVRRGRNSAIFSSWDPWTEEERARIRDLNEAFYRTFVSKAAEGRQRTPEEIDAVAQGRVWTGEQALENDLVDGLGGLNAALDMARERAGIPSGQQVRLVVLPATPGVWSAFLQRRQEEVLGGALEPDARSLIEWALQISGQGPLARIPFQLEVR
jgi:protease-4